VLKAIPDIWAERFVDEKAAPEAAYVISSLCAQSLLPEAGLAEAGARLVWARLVLGSLTKQQAEKVAVIAALAAQSPLVRDGPAAAGSATLLARLAYLDDKDRRAIRFGFISPVRLAVTRPDGNVATLLIGAARTFDRPGSPAHTARYAQLVGNDQLFEIKTGSYESLLTSGDSLRDERLARFDNKDVKRIEVDLPGQQIVLVHSKEKVKFADKGEEREEDRWKLEKPIQGDADTFLVSELLNDLSNLRVQPADVHFQVDEKKDGLDKPAATAHLTIEETKGEGANKHTTTRMLTVQFGKPIANKTYVRVGGRDLISSVTGPVVTAVNRKGLDLLKRDLLTVDTSNIQRLQKSGTEGTLTLHKDDGGSWEITDAPVPSFKAQTEAVDALLGVWSNLRAERFVSYGAKADLARYGLDKPAVTVKIVARTDGGAASLPSKRVEHTLSLGKPVEKPTVAILCCLPGPGLPVNLLLAALAEGPHKNLFQSLGGSADERYARLSDREGVFVLGGFPVKELKRTYLDFLDPTVLKFDAEQVRALQRRMGSEDLEVDKGDAGWELVKPAKQRADKRTLDDLMSQLAKSKAKRVAAYPAQDLKPFGLDVPAAVVKLRLAEPEGKMLELRLGKIADEPGAPASGDRFAQLAGSHMVVVLPGNLAKPLVAGSVEFRDRTLPTFQEADGVVLERGPRRATFAKVDGTWKLTAPIMAAAEHDQLEDFVNAMSHLRADEWVGDKPGDLKTSGLDHPQARWRFQLGGKPELELLVGGYEKTAAQSPPATGRRCYARLKKAGSVRLVGDVFLAACPASGFLGGLMGIALAQQAQHDSADLVFLLDPKTTNLVLGEYRERAPWSALESNQVESLTYHTSRGTFTLKKVGTLWQVAGMANLTVNSTAINDTLDTLSKLKAERFIVDQCTDLKPYGLDPPQLTIEIQSRTGGKYVLYVGAKDKESQHYFARVPQGNRSDVFLLADTDGSRIVRELSAFTQPGLPGFKPPGR
jgi:hypothetical protein